MRSPDAPPFALKGIEHVLLLVSGLDRALAFYEGVLGARVESRLPKYAMVELRAGNCHLDLVDVTAPEGAWAMPPVVGGRNIDHVGLRLEVPDEAALRQHLSANGVEIVEERLEEEAGRARLSLYVRDPAGNTIELMTSRSW